MDREEKGEGQRGRAEGYSGWVVESDLLSSLSLPL